MVHPDTLVINDKDYTLHVPVVRDVDVNLPMIAVFDCVLDYVNSHLLQPVWVTYYLLRQKMIVVNQVLQVNDQRVLDF